MTAARRGARHRAPAIEDHGAIGNLRTIGLVARDGSIDWLCLPHLDSPSVFAALLDPQRGGRFQVRAADGPRQGEQRYLPHTNVLETAFDAAAGRLIVTDFQPLTGSLDAPSESQSESSVVRMLRAQGGDVDVDLEWSPRFGYADAETRMARAEHGWLAWAGPDAMTLSGVDEDVRIDDDGVGPVLRARLRMRAGERRALVARWGSQPPGIELREAQRVLEATIEAWRAWVHKADATGPRSWAEPHSELIVRSELVLKLLTHADTGAIAAAATTSLPEEIGGVRNWDYRFSWIRDAGLAAQAMYALGHRTEAHAFIEWAERSARDEGTHSWGLQLVYGLHGGPELDERELPGLAGYRQSAPVRIGNGAVDQLQLDIYGELISAAYEVVRLGGDLRDDIIQFLPSVADEACASWQQPDYGLWELRNGPFSFVYSKVMVWMGLDRASRLVRRGVIDGEVQRWQATMEAIVDDVLTRGFDSGLGAFAQSYERGVLDASNVLIPLQEFLPFDDPRVVQTLDRTLAELTENGYVYRYHANDGVAGGEGAFGLCTFWLADALALSGRVDEAEELFEGMVAAANHVGLYSEQIDPATRTFLGNFPQAFSHLGLINSSLYLASAQGRAIPLPSLIGSEQHRQAD
jgi:GH15 family glucan-1,4-alpha-glucosidase